MLDSKTTLRRLDTRLSSIVRQLPFEAPSYNGQTVLGELIEKL